MPQAEPPPDADEVRERDAAWMRRVQTGDAKAFHELILAYQSKVAAAAARMAGPGFDPEEIAHEVFVRIWKSAHRYEPSAKLSTWLLTITRNLVLNELRYKARHPTVSRDASPEEGGTPVDAPAAPHDNRPDSLLLGKELQQAIDAALQKLPENQRTALVLRRYEELSYEEIAAVLQVSVPSVKSILFRARAEMRLLLKEYL